VSRESLEQLYSSKTDDELLAVAADYASLREETKPILANELRRRNLAAVPIDNEQIPNLCIPPPKPYFFRALRFGGVLLLNTCVAVVGTSALAAEIGGALHPHSFSGILWKLWGLDVLCALLIGFFMWRTRKTEATKWTWTLPALWFCLRFIPALTFRGHQTVFGSVGVWSQLSGVGCENGVRALGCLNLFVFTLPFISGVSYSIGACFSSMVSPPNPSATRD
jgi:hypothetical protein